MIIFFAVFMAAFCETYKDIVILKFNEDYIWPSNHSFSKGESYNIKLDMVGSDNRDFYTCFADSTTHNCIWRWFTNRYYSDKSGFINIDTKRTFDEDWVIKYGSNGELFEFPATIEIDVSGGTLTTPKLIPMVIIIIISFMI